MFRQLSRLYGNESYFISIKETRFWFKVLNETIFKNKLRPFRYIFLKRHSDQLAATNPYTIYDDQTKEELDRFCNLEINPKMKSFELFLSVLAHEMIHLYQYTIEKRGLGHGYYFKKWKNKIEKCGLPFAIEYDIDKFGKG